MQKHTIEITEFQLRPSRLMRSLNIFLHTVVFGLLFLGRTMPLLWLTVTVLLGYSAWQLDRRFSLRSTKAIRHLRHDADGWSVGGGDGLLYPITLRSGTTVTAAFVVLSWRDSRQRHSHLLLTVPMLGSASYRRLCRLLWQNGKSGQVDVQSV